MRIRGLGDVARNVTMASLVRPGEVDGVRVGMNERAVRALDGDLLAAAERGMTVTLVDRSLAADRGHALPPAWRQPARGRTESGTAGA